MGWGDLKNHRTKHVSGSLGGNSIPPWHPTLSCAYTIMVPVSTYTIMLTISAYTIDMLVKGMLVKGIIDNASP
jgi:hypothetical protein